MKADKRVSFVGWRDADSVVDGMQMEVERSPEEMLEKRLTCLKGILESEEVYLRELDALLMVNTRSRLIPRWMERRETLAVNDNYS